MTDKKTDHISRRTFLKNSAITLGSVAAAASFGGGHAFAANTKPEVFSPGIFQVRA